MDWLNIIYYVISAIAGLVITGVPFIINLKGKKNATADADLLATAKNFISAAEVAFEGFDKVMKAQGSSAGAMKKDTVFSKLQAYALSKGYAFNADEWSEKIDELVEFTKSVNAQKVNKI